VRQGGFGRVLWPTTSFLWRVRRLACSKFAILEQEINERIFDLLKLEGAAADVVAHSVDFFKKWSLLRFVAIEKTPPRGRERVRNIFSGIEEQNRNRILMAHCRFEPAANDSVQFRRTVVKAEIKIDDPLWSPQKFEIEFKKLDDLRAKLIGLKPLKTDEDRTSELISGYMSLTGETPSIYLSGVSKHFLGPGRSSRRHQP
jgi:hypothetical protein